MQMNDGEMITRREWAANLRRAMRRRGYSAQRLSFESEVNINTINNYLTGNFFFSADTLRKLQAALGCRWEELLGEPLNVGER